MSPGMGWCCPEPPQGTRGCQEGLCLWCHPPARHLTMPCTSWQHCVSCMPLPHPKCSSASHEMLTKSCNVQTLWFWEPSWERQSGNRHPDVRVTRLVAADVCAVLTAVRLWKGGLRNVKKHQVLFVNINSKPTHCRKSVQVIHASEKKIRCCILAASFSQNYS